MFNRQSIQCLVAVVLMAGMPLTAQGTCSVDCQAVGNAENKACKTQWDAAKDKCKTDEVADIKAAGNDAAAIRAAKQKKNQCNLAADAKNKLCTDTATAKLKQCMIDCNKTTPNISGTNAAPPTRPNLQPTVNVQPTR